MSLVLLGSIFLSGCWVTILSGPTEVRPGQTVTYELELEGELGDSNMQIFVLARVPMGWELQSSLFEGTIDGATYSEPGRVAHSTSCDTLAGFPSTDFKLLKLTVGPYNRLGFTGKVTLSFLANDQPEGQFKAFFFFGYDSDYSGGCAATAARTINRDSDPPVALETVYSATSETDANQWPTTLEISPRGDQVLVAFRRADELQAFSRDRGTGELLAQRSYFHNSGSVDGLAGISDIIFDPTGSHAYVSSEQDHAIGVFARTDTGELTPVQVVVDGTDGVQGLNYVKALEIAGDYLYALSPADGALSTFARDPETGLLTFLGETILASPIHSSSTVSLTASPDGENLYVGWADPGRILRLSRDPANGFVSDEIFLEDIFGDWWEFGDLVTSRDGKFLYSAAIVGSAIIVHRRDEIDGGLEPVETLSLEDFGPALAGPRSLVLTSGDDYLFTGAQNSLTTFVRDSTTGKLTLMESVFDKDPDPGFESIQEIVLTPHDDQVVVLSADRDKSLTVFENSLFDPMLFEDGFESGDFSRWSLSIP